MQAPLAIQSSHRLGTRSWLLLLLFGVSLLTLNLGDYRVLSFHEVLFAQPAKEMLASGSWLIPTIAGVPSNHKPPLEHWSIAVSMATFGNTAWAVRLPSVLAGLATVCITALLAARWFGERIGVLSGMVQITAFYFVRQARLAEADMLLGACVCGALAAFAAANVDSPRGKSRFSWLPCFFYLATGLSCLAKGPIGAVFILGACASYALWERDRECWRFLVNPLGLLVFAMCVVPWPAAAYWRLPAIWEDWRHHNLGRFQGELEGQRPLPYYLYVIPGLLLPWTPFLWRPAVWALRRRERLAPFWRFCLCWVVPGLIVITASVFKRKHYPVPLLPPLCILAAIGLWQLAASHYRHPWLSRRWEAALLAAFGAVGCIVLRVLRLEFAEVFSLCTAVVAGAMILWLWFEHRRQMAWGLGSVFAAAWLVTAMLQHTIVPATDPYHEQFELAARTADLTPAGETLQLVQLPENEITYYLPGRLHRVDKSRLIAAEFAALPQTVNYIVAPERSLPHLQKLGTVEELARCQHACPDLPKGERILLFRLTVRPSSETVAAGQQLTTSKSGPF